MGDFGGLVCSFPVSPLGVGAGVSKAGLNSMARCLVKHAVLMGVLLVSRSFFGWSSGQYSMANIPCLVGSVSACILGFFACILSRSGWECLLLFCPSCWGSLSALNFSISINLFLSSSSSLASLFYGGCTKDFWLY